MAENDPRDDRRPVAPHINMTWRQLGRFALHTPAEDEPRPGSPVGPVMTMRHLFED